MDLDRVYHRIDESPDIKYREQGYTYATRLGQESLCERGKYGNCYGFSVSVINPLCLVSCETVKELGGIRNTLESIFTMGSRYTAKSENNSLFLNHYRNGVLRREHRMNFNYFSHVTFDTAMDMGQDGDVNAKTCCFIPDYQMSINKRDCGFDFLNRPKKMASQIKSGQGEALLQTHEFIAACRDLPELQQLYSPPAGKEQDDAADFFVWSMNYLLQKNVAAYAVHHDLPLLAYPEYKRSPETLATVQKLCAGKKDEVYPFAPITNPLSNPVALFNGMQLVTFLRNGEPMFNARKTEKLAPWYVAFRENHEKTIQNRKSSLTMPD